MKKISASIFSRFLLSALLVLQLVGIGTFAPASVGQAAYLAGRGLNSVYSHAGKTSFPFNTVLDFSDAKARLGDHPQTGQYIVITGVNSQTVRLAGAFGFHDNGYVPGGQNTSATIDEETVQVKTWSPKDGAAPDFSNPTAVAALKNAIRVGSDATKYDSYGVIDNCDATTDDLPMIIPGADNSASPATQNVCYNTNYLNTYNFQISNYQTGSVLVLYAGASQVVNPANKSVVTTPAADYRTTSLSVYGLQITPVNTGSPQITLTKTAKHVDGSVITGPLVAGSDVVYQLNYQNTGSAATSTATLSDTFDTNYVASVTNNGGGKVAGNKVSWNLGTLAAGASGVKSFQVKLLPKVNDKVAGVYDVPNTATITAGSLTANANKTVQVAYTDNPYIIKTAKVFAPNGTNRALSQARPGDVIAYTLEYGNNGTAKMTNARLEDTMNNNNRYSIIYTTPGAVTTPSGTDTKVVWNPVGDAGNCRPSGKGCGEPAPVQDCSVAMTAYGCTRASGIRQIFVKLNSVFPTGNTPLNDAATLITDQGTRQASTSVIVPAAADCVITKAVDKAIANPGDEITYTLTYTNKSVNAICTSATIEDPLSNLNQKYLTVVAGSASNGGTLSSAGGVEKVSWTIGNVEPGTSGSVSFKAKIDSSFPDLTGPIQVYIKNDGKIFYAEAPQGVPSNEVTTLVGTGPVLNIIKAVDKSQANPGDNLVYTLTIKNTGNSAAANAVMKDPFTNQNQNFLTYVSSSVVKGAGDAYALGTLNVGETKTVTITSKISSTIPAKQGGTTILDVADVTADTVPTVKSNQVATILNPVALLTITKAVSTETAKPNDTFKYTLTYANTGNARANNVIVTDPFTNPGQQYIDFVSASPAPDPGSTNQWTIGAVDPGKTGTITITARVKNVVPQGQTKIHDISVVSSNETGSKKSNEVTLVVVYTPPAENPPVTPRPVPTTGQSLSIVLALAGMVGLIAVGVYLHRKRKQRRMMAASAKPEGTVPPVTTQKM